MANEQDYGPEVTETNLLCYYVYFQMNSFQFHLSSQFSSIWPTNRALPGITTAGVLCIPQTSSITRTSQSDFLVSYLGQSWGSGGVLPLCRESVGVFYSSSRLAVVI